MVNPFETTARKVGTSLGVLIPKEASEELGLKEGETVSVTILKRKKLHELVKSGFGIARGMPAFVRERSKRELQ